MAVCVLVNSSFDILYSVRNRGSISNMLVVDPRLLTEKNQTTFIIRCIYGHAAPREGSSPSMEVSPTCFCSQVVNEDISLNSDRTASSI